MIDQTMRTQKLLQDLKYSPWPFVSARRVRTMIDEFYSTREQYENIVRAWRNDFATKLYEWKDALRQCDELQRNLIEARQEITRLEEIISQKPIDVDANEG